MVKLFSAWILALTPIAAVAESTDGGASKRSTCQKPETGQETDNIGGIGRAAIWEQSRLDRLEEIEPKTTSKSVKLLLWLEEGIGEPVPSTGVDPVDDSLQLRSDDMADLGLFDYRDRFFPRIGSIRDGSGLSGGVRFFKRDWGPGLDIDVTGAVSVNGYQFYSLRFGRLSTIRAPDELQGRAMRNRPNPFFAYLDLRYSDFKDEDLYLGSDSSLESEISFRMGRATYSAITGYRIDSHLTVSGRAGFSQIGIGEGEVEIAEGEFEPVSDGFGVVNPIRLEQGTDFLELSASLIADYRDVPGDPNEGIAASLSIARFDDRSADRFQFTRYAGQAQGYVPLGSPQRRLVLALLLSSDVADAGKAIPFYLLRTLGGSRTLRGFADQRFRGKNLLHMTVEYRWEPSPYWELAVFWDGGKVFQDFDRGFDLADLEKSVGFGTRFKTAGAVALRLEVAFSREATRFHVGFGTVF